MFKALIALVVIFFIATFPATWLLMLFLGNVGLGLSYWGTLPLGILDAPDHAHLVAVVRNPLTKLVLFGVCVLALFHWAHRFRFTLEHGLQLGRFDRVIALCCYGTAVLGSAAAGWVLLTA